MKIRLFVFSIVIHNILIVETTTNGITTNGTTTNATATNETKTETPTSPTITTARLTTISTLTTAATTRIVSTTRIVLTTAATTRIVSTTRIVPVQGPHHHPIYRYSCNEDLSVTFKGVNGAIEYFPAANKTDNCTIKNILGHNGNFKIAKECLSSMNFKEKRWMQVAVYDKNEGETVPTSTTTTPTASSTTTTNSTTSTPTTTTNNTTTTTPTASSTTTTNSTTSTPTTTNTPSTRISPQLITGHHIFNLTCLPLKEEGVDRIALAETGITDIEQLHNVYNEIGQVEMRFKESESLNKPDLSEVYIGDRFYMYLKYMGDTEDYIIVPQTCTAYKGTYRTNSGKHLELWKQSSRINTTNDCRTPDAKQYKVMENFKRSNKTIVHAELHGFRFSSDLTGDFDDVTISCIVKICTSAIGPCKDNCNINGKRRRRGIDKTADYMYKAKRSTGRIRSQTVFQTIKVGQREFKSNNGGKNGVHGGTVAILVVAGVVFWKAIR